MKNNVIVIGSANADLVIHSDAMPKLGETLVGRRFQINAGGKGLNQAVAIAKLGGNVSFLGAVGEDDNGTFLVNTLRQYGVAFEGVVSDTAPTGIAMITVVGGDNFILLDAGANGTLTPEWVLQIEPRIAESDFCVLQLEIPAETVLEICRIAHHSGTKIVLNPAPFQKLPETVYACVDYLIPNEHEAEALTGVSIHNGQTAVEAVQSIQALGVKHVVITLGENGCVYSDGSAVRFHPAANVTVVDTTSAGDCFIGALVAQLSQNVTLSDAIAFATQAAAIAVTREGAAKSIPFANEVK